jgi:hypothetical protein
MISTIGGGGGAADEFFKYAHHPLFKFGLRNAALQTVLGRPGELLFLDLDFGLLAVIRTSREAIYLG